MRSALLRLSPIAAAAVCAALLFPALALAEVPGEGEEVEYGTKISSPCSLTNQQADDDLQVWTLTTLDPKRQYSPEGEEELAPEKMPRPEGFPTEPETFYRSKLEGEETPTEEGCKTLSTDPFASVVEGNELAVREPGPYILEQIDFKVHWELVKGSPAPKKCGGNDQYYPEPSSELQSPETEPPSEYSWEITSYCNTVKAIKFNLLGGEGLCSGEKQDMSLFPQVPYFNQYDTGARLDLPISSSKKGGNACGPSSLLMAMRWNIDFTAGREEWSTQELINATKALPSLYKTYDATMAHTRETQGTQSNHLEWEKALKYARSLGWTQAKAVCIGTNTKISKKKTECKTNLVDIAYANQQKITEALDQGPILISTVFSTRRWGETGGGHVIMVFGFDRTNPNDVDVYDPAGNYFSTPKSHYYGSSKGGHYGPGSCGYGVPYPMSWLLAFTTGRVFISLGDAPKADPPVIGISDADPESASAPDDFYLQDPAGDKAGWVEGEPVEEIPGAFVGQTQNSYTDPSVEDAEANEEVITEEPIPPAPRSITLNSPPPGTVLHVGSEEGGSFALDEEEWKDGEVVDHDELAGPVSAGQDEVVPAPSLDAAIADTESEQQQQPEEHTTPTPEQKAQGPPTGGGGASGGIAVAAHLAQLKGGKVLVKLSCPSAQACHGKVKLADGSPLGSAAFTIPAGGKRTVAVKLSRSGLTKLERGRAHAVAVTLSGNGVKRRTLSVKAAGGS